jgi:hypothetical protein
MAGEAKARSESIALKRIMETLNTQISTGKK